IHGSARHASSDRSEWRVSEDPAASAAASRKVRSPTLLLHQIVGDESTGVRAERQGGRARGTAKDAKSAKSGGQGSRGEGKETNHALFLPPAAVELRLLRTLGVLRGSILLHAQLRRLRLDLPPERLDQRLARDDHLLPARAAHADRGGSGLGLAAVDHG